MRQTLDESRILKLSNDKNESQLKISIEQTENLKVGIEEMSVKKYQETEMMNKEISSLTLKERDAKQSAYMMEGHLGEARDELRIVAQELDSRSRENEHLVSLLEDQE